ncbi:MAG: hypothetical protein MUC88_16075 [Planctomycetes bacterium]|nr:hypothetical protein [Planctomycetota bacterium]
MTNGDASMRRLAGSLLVLLSLVCVVATALWLALQIVDARHQVNANLGETLLVGFLVGGAFLLLAGILFLMGRQMRNPRPNDSAAAVPHGPQKFWALLTYLGASVAVAAAAGIVTACAPGESAVGRLLWCLTVPPSLIVQFIRGSMSPLRPASDLTSGLILVYHVLYFAAFFYPIYSMATLDRTVETIRYRRMKVLLGLFCSMHLLLAILFALMLSA